MSYHGSYCHRRSSSSSSSSSSSDSDCGTRYTTYVGSINPVPAPRVVVASQQYVAPPSIGAHPTYHMGVQPAPYPPAIGTGVTVTPNHPPIGSGVVPQQPYPTGQPLYNPYQQGNQPQPYNNQPGYIPYNQPYQGYRPY